MVDNIIQEISFLDNEETIVNYYETLKTNCDKSDLFDLMKEIIHYIDDLYYNEGTSPWSDNQYDLFIDILSKDFCEFNKNTSEKIGSEIKSDNNIVQLPYFMASMNKYKKLSEIQNWQKKIQGSVWN